MGTHLLPPHGKGHSSAPRHFWAHVYRGQTATAERLLVNCAAVNYRRPGLSSRCSPCLELSAAARHVCTVSSHLPKLSEDSPLQPLLFSCQAREVIPSLRPFLLLLVFTVTTFHRMYFYNFANVYCRVHVQVARARASIPFVLLALF